MVKLEESLAKIDAEMMSKGSDVEVCVCVCVRERDFVWVGECVRCVSVCVYRCGCVGTSWIDLV
jgi:hypothetical protein